MTNTDRNHSRHERFLRQAVDLARERVKEGKGGPFAALVVKEDRVIGSGFNAVTSSNDPTAHAEIQAVRAACQANASFQLDGCDVYSSCEPCPMCLGALYWARPRAVYFAATRADAASAGFDDAFIYDELGKPREQRTLPFTHMAVEGSKQPFEAWLAQPRRIPY
jgi:guanine deaminase